MAHRSTSSITPGRPRKLPPATTNTQMSFVENIDYCNSDVDDIDENFPIIRDVPLYDHHPHQSHSQRPTQKKSTFYTPQIKRKRMEDQAPRVNEDLFTQEISTVKLMLKESHQKMDMMFKRQENIEKEVDHMNKLMNKLSRHVIKKVTPTPPSSELPVVDLDGRNILSGPPRETPLELMKSLINELFNKAEIMEGKHQEINQRTEKIKEAVQSYFFQDDPLEFKLFWEGQGHLTRGNQKRGLLYRKNHSSANTENIEQ